MDNVFEFSQIAFAELLLEASNSERQRQHRNIHKSYDENCQRLLNAIELDSYIQPHRHLLDPKPETLIAILGCFALYIFDEFGRVENIIKIGSEKYLPTLATCVGVEIPPKSWHTIVALEPNSILFEMKSGPFDPSRAKELAKWAPSEDSPSAKVYLQDLRSLA